MAFLFTSLAVAPQAAAQTQYTVTASVSGAGGTVSPASQSVAAGGTATVTVTWNDGYRIGSITDNGVKQTFSPDYSAQNHRREFNYIVTNVQANRNVVVAFIAYERMRTYKSSVDGANLVCTITKPDPANCADRTRIPLWVDLHAFGGHGDGPPAAGDMFVLSPWGRTLRSMYVDGRDLGAVEPSIFDDFAASAAGWTPMNGAWSVSGGAYRQTDRSAWWKVSDRADSTGSDYAVSVDMRETVDVAGETAMGVLFRKQPATLPGGGANPDANDCYWVDLYNNGDANGAKIFLRLFVFDYATLNWKRLAEDPISDGAGQINEDHPFWTNGVNLKVNVFEDAIEVRLNDLLFTLDPNNAYNPGNLTLLGRMGRVSDKTLGSGSVALASYGSEHSFDNFRVQNDFLLGETDVIDCINQFIEDFSVDPNYRVDPTKIYLSGYSMGGVGTYNVGLHHPDLFGALHPACGATDMMESLNYIRNNYKDDQPPIDPWPFHVEFNAEQDGYIAETADAMLDGDPAANPAIFSAMRENSARWILENGLYTPMRMQHPEYDSLIPNVVAPYATTCMCGGNPHPGKVWIWWATTNGPWLFHTPIGVWLSYGWEVAFLDPATLYAHADYVYRKRRDVSGLSRCQNETSGFGANGEAPADPNLIWDDGRNYSHCLSFGAHSNPQPAQWNDDAVEVWQFWNRATTAHYARRLNPPEVAYKAYDSQHNKAWWLKVEPAFPEQSTPTQDRAALARVVNGLKVKEIPGRAGESNFNGAEVKAKNVKTVTLDVQRMGLNTASGQTLTFRLSNNTAPESEPLTDAWNKTTLVLVGTFYPNASYTVRLNGTTRAHTKTATTLTVADIPLSGSVSTLTVTVPSGLTNLLASSDPGFESGGSGWTNGSVNSQGAPVAGSGTFAVDSVEQAHSGTRSARIKDAQTGTSPFISGWISPRVTVSANTNYSASAFVKTRTLQSVTRKFSGGKYDPAYNSYAGVGIIWYNGTTRLSMSVVTAGIGGSNDWTPVELRNVRSPSNANGAQVIVFCKSPDSSGSKGSVWVDDVALRR